MSYFSLLFVLIHRNITTAIHLKKMCFLIERPDFNDAIIMRRGASVEHVVSRTDRIPDVEKCICSFVVITELCL